MNRLAVCLCAVALLAHAAPNVAGERTLATFDVVHSGATVGKIEWRIDQHDNGDVRFATVNRTVGIAKLVRNVTIRATSEGRFEGGRYQSQHYRYEREGDKRAGYVDATFDHQRGAIRIERLRKGELERREEVMAAPVTDELGHLLALGAALAAGDTTLAFPVLRRDKVREYRYQMEGEESIDTPFGQFKAIRLKRDRANDANRSTTVWSAPRIAYVPARIDHREKSRNISILLTSWSIKPL